ncbi:Short chain fatty acid transporter [Verrucomicrobia bacterium SCGC AG-212-E04]|nr:Short chain fatty acid transporter [Verrucomicrobia bacterium SCGC AG-212-E04]
MFARLGASLSDWSERWFPDAFVFALLAVVIVVAAALMLGSKPLDIAKWFGTGFWSFVPFTMQMVVIVVSGYVVASSPPVYKLIVRLAEVPNTPRGAVAYVAFVSTFTSLISYGLSLIFAGFLAREIAARLKVDYRAIGAAAYLGLGSIWALGLSSSAALMMNSKGLIPPAILKISGEIPLSATIYTWQSILTAVVLMLVSVLVAWLTVPMGDDVRTLQSYNLKFDSMQAPLEPRTKPGEWLEYTPILTLFIALLGFAYLWTVRAEKGWLQTLDLPNYNLFFLMLGLALHWRARSFTNAVSAAVPATAGIIVQFPFYAGIAAIITSSTISKDLAELFVRVTTADTYPILVSIYSAVLGLFAPSGGGKWVIEAPYVLQAAIDQKVNLGWVVQIYNTAEALPNLVNPFWMLPLLGILKMKARDLVGFGLVQLIVHTPIVLFLMWLLARTFTFVPPVIAP